MVFRGRGHMGMYVLRTQKSIGEASAEVACMFRAY